MTELTNYEVQVQQDGRWSIHARFQDHQKEAAITEAQELDRLSSIEAVKVIKEVYDQDQGFHNEFIVYKSPGMKSSLSTDGGGKSSGASMGYGGGSQDMSWLDDDSDDGLEDGFGDDFEDDFEDIPTRGRKSPRRARKKKKGSGLTSTLVKLLLVILFSLVIGGIFAALADEFIGGMRLFGIKFVGNAQSNLLIGVFITAFLISTVMMALTVMRGATIKIPNQRRPVKKPVKTAQQPRQRTAPKPAKNSAGNSAAAGPSVEAINGVAESQVGHQTNEEKAPEDTSATERLQAALKTDKESEEAKRAVILDAETHAKAPAPEVEALSPADEKQKAYILKFLSLGLEGSQPNQKKMDNFNKFGVNLYLAGACEILSQKRNMDIRSRSRILADSVQVMGFKRSHAASFADRYEEYLMADARYMQMFQAGRNAINIFMTDETVAPRLLDNALVEWNKPKDQEEQTGPITVLFTDIAGSTAMTQRLGDAGAQQIVRVHNRIVREALSNNAGKEIKHTGDGIMASFNKTSDGVDASIEMQRGTALHTAQNPDLPLHLKIGLNAGEPIAEDNDLFGTTVQLSARIVDKASADQIFVSEIVRGICAGKNYNFANRGGFPMKGFGDEITLYEVIWSEDGEIQKAGE